MKPLLVVLLAVLLFFFSSRNRSREREWFLDDAVFFTIRVNIIKGAHLFPLALLLLCVGLHEPISSLTGRQITSKLDPLSVNKGLCVCINFTHYYVVVVHVP